MAPDYCTCHGGVSATTLMECPVHGDNKINDTIRVVPVTHVLLATIYFSPEEERVTGYFKYTIDMAIRPQEVLAPQGLMVLEAFQDVVTKVFEQQEWGHLPVHWQVVPIGDPGDEG